MWLRQKAGDVAHIDARVVGADRDPKTGDVKALLLDGDTRIEAGSSSIAAASGALIQGYMHATWHSFAANLPVNRGMLLRLDHDPARDIAPYTLAAAQSAGCIRAIHTQERFGCGFVYSDRFLDPDGAQRKIERVLGRWIEPHNDLKFDAGRIGEAWAGNCLAVGLSSSFLETFEATYIHGNIVQMMRFT